jgi:hypothetical protein
VTRKPAQHDASGRSSCRPRPVTSGSREEIEAELDLIAAAIRTFHRKQPDQVMRECAGYSARLTEMAVLLHRVEGSNRQYTRIRTQQVERFLAELDRQFKTASRWSRSCARTWSLGGQT